MVSVTREVESHPSAKGLAIIITNDYIGTPPWPQKLDELPGTVKDGENLSKTFTSLQFVIHWEHNVTKKRLEFIMYEVKNLKHKKLKDYKCIVLVFSGHGTTDNYVYMYDRERVHISNQLIDPLLPKHCTELGNIPKLFFIDACRGSKTLSTVLVPRGKSASEDPFSSRGLSQMQQLKVPEGANFLVAYSTMPDYKAYEDGSGGIWLRLLAETIMKSPDTSILDVLTDVNRQLTEMNQSKDFAVQQPEKTDRLNKKVVLLDTENGQASVIDLDEVTPSINSPKRKPINIAAVFPGGSSSSHLPQPTGMLMGNPHLQPHVYSTPTASQQTPSPATNSQGQWALPHGQQHHTPPQGNLQQPVQPNLPKYQAMLSQFACNYCTIPPNYETVDFYSTEHKQMYFKSGVRVYLQNGDTITEDSRKYYNSPALSLEEAAKNACERIAQVQWHSQQQQCNGGAHSQNQQWPTPVHNPVGTVNTSPQQLYPQQSQAAAASPMAQQSYTRPSYNVASVPAPSLPQQRNPQSQLQVSGRGAPPSGSCREQLNQFFQTKRITPQFDYVSDNTGGQSLYRCTIKYFMNGKTERVDSGGYYNSKGEAKEIAARKVLNKETKGGKVEMVARGRNTTPQDKLWKSKLKEFYDKQRQPNALIEYKTLEVALGRFQSTVSTSDLRHGVTGDVCDSKKDAEQNAAQRALKILEQ